MVFADDWFDTITAFETVYFWPDPVSYTHLDVYKRQDLYYSSYLPQFFYAMLSPLLLFGICVFINWRVAAVLLACVPLIPVSIVAVSRFAKRIFAKYLSLIHI